MRKVLLLFVVACCLALFAGALSIPGQDLVLQAQKTCDPKVEKCDEGTPCSPGYWKNHLDEFYLYCDAAADSSDFDDCADILTALTCRGSDASCRRSEAAAAMNAITGCTEG